MILFEYENEEEEHIVHFIYEPNGVLAPVNVGDECTYFTKTYGFLICFFHFFLSFFLHNTIFTHLLFFGDQHIRC